MRVTDEIRKSVVFIGTVNRMGEITYGGTGFLVTVPGVETQKPVAAYVITAKHVLEQIRKETGDNPFAVRVNKTDGTSFTFSAGLDHWHYHPDPTVDIAVSAFSPPSINPNELDISFIPAVNFLTDEDIVERSIGAGDDVYATGLFTKAVGVSRNMPIVRTGNIALMPSEKIPHGDATIEAYLIEGRSIGGLSGSPAFVSETVFFFQHHPTKKDREIMVGASGQVFLLGVVRGHWDVLPNRSLLETEKVNMGVSVVVPAKKIKEILYLPELVEMRKKHEEMAQKLDQESATMDVDFSPPFSKEDFEAALNKATRKIPDKK